MNDSQHQSRASSLSQIMFNAEMKCSLVSFEDSDLLSQCTYDQLSEIELEIAENKSDTDLSDRFEMVERPEVKTDSIEMMMMNKGVKRDEESKESH